MKLILWDIDGTLLLAYGAGRRAMEHTGRRVFGEAFDMSATKFAGQLNPRIVRDAAERSGYPVDEASQESFRTLYIEQLRQELHAPHTRCELLPGVADLLELLLPHRLLRHGLVTGNYAEAATVKLDRVGIGRDRFGIGAFGGEAPTRPGLVELALERDAAGSDAPPTRTVVIGDTPHDVECAHAHGCQAIAVATGGYSREQLSDCGADLVLDDFLQPEPLLEQLLEDG